MFAYMSRIQSTRFLLSIIGLMFLTFLSFNTHSQNEVKDDDLPKFRGAIMMANSHVPAATEAGKKVAIMPTWGFDFDYFFHKRWSVALQGDVKLQSFETEDNNTLLKRNYPFTAAVALHFHLKKHWSFYAGPGYEFEPNKNLALIKFGTEYSFEMTDNFEIALNLIYENKQNVYDSWTFGIAFNRKLWSKK